jgi:lipid-A-disaccharide synthase-like uncharacterized protein
MTWPTILGWVGNAAFFSRFLVQWFVSERAGRSLAPGSFWWLSLVGAGALGTFCLLSSEPVLFAGIAVNATIAARNLWIASRRKRRRPAPGLLLLPFGVAAAAILLWAAVGKATEVTDSPAWLACSIVGQAFWSSRFVVQWWATERRRESHFPRTFWWLSLAGNLLLLTYAIHRQKAVLIAGFVPGPLVQVRNLMLSRRRPTSD